MWVVYRIGARGVRIKVGQLPDADATSTTSALARYRQLNPLDRSEHLVADHVPDRRTP